MSLKRVDRPAKPHIRLLWDEDLSLLVPKALRVLGFRTTYVGSPDEQGVPSKGTPDSGVVEFAQRTNQIIVTRNHDMMTLCADRGQRFVWLDPRGKRLSREQQVLLVFTQIHDWQQHLADDPTCCVLARRTACRPIAPPEAARLAANRIRRIQQRKRRLARTPRPMGELFTVEDHE